ncbi:MAG: NACHT domain-containing protein [Desulfobaccales bacterium]|nr:NACHT domain-containing protein [Desulfobaccales bacterium]
MDASLRILASTNNARGDLFTRLIKDLFFALGYDDLRLNVHKTGRELDIQGQHRIEPRRVVAECKAHTAKMGGDELNKFLGVLTRERKKNAPTPVTGYFVSLSGFTETGIQQEEETGDDRVILLKAEQVISELERSRVLVGRTVAAERAGQCAHHGGLTDAVLEDAELLGHERGYLWAIHYSRNKELTHFALIHADGTPLAEPVAREVIDADRQCSGILHSLHYLAPAPPPPERAKLAAEAITRYRQWLGEECGFIQLDGLPADTDLSATRMKLERLFVPLKAYYLSEPKDETDKEAEGENKVLPIGEMLSESTHLALLATPGGGKSTLLKRLAIAYAFPERRVEVSDDLPDRSWLPLFLRCRELRDRAYRPILEILDDLPRHAGMNELEAGAFRESVHEILRAGRALLLVDGLDEISEEGARQVFANNLRTFLAVFPKAAIVVASREAGFRLVAGVVASACVRAKLAPFDKHDVQQLCERWHLQVVGDNEKVRTDARDLARTIWQNERIRTLAENPLLLTTLLVIKRWIGELPRNRAALYREAVRVLIRTWNVEGYAPLDEEETLAQLSYVACAMMEQGTQRIGQKALTRLLQQARQELEAELHFVAISATGFIERIEYRSSLLMQTGHDILEGEFQPVYEFRHLTFQEYLAARGYVEEQYPGRAEGQALLHLLEPHFEDERWREVVALSAVLAGRRAEPIMKRLAAVCANIEWLQRDPRESGRPQVILLKQCLLDEVQVTTPTLRAALEQVARHVRDVPIEPIRKKGTGMEQESALIRLRRGKYGTLLQQVTEDSYLSGRKNWEEYELAIADLAFEEQFQSSARVQMSASVSHSLLKAIETGERIEKVRAALVGMRLAFSARHRDPRSEPARPDELFQPLRDAICGMLNPNDPPLALAASWALAWIGDTRRCTAAIDLASMLCLYQIWKDSPWQELSRFAAWAFAAQPLLPRDTFSKDVWGSCDAFLEKASGHEKSRKGRISQRAALVVAWYRQAPWNDGDLVRVIADVIEPGDADYTMRDLLENLGDAGRQVLQKLREKKDEAHKKPRKRR